jgi:hypothetical protein
MPASYARRQRKAKTKQFSLDSKDIGKLYNVIFASPPDPKYADQVTAFAAPAGREAIGRFCLTLKSLGVHWLAATRKYSQTTG